MGLDKRPTRTSKQRARERVKQTYSDRSASDLDSDPDGSYDHGGGGVNYGTPPLSRKRSRGSRRSKIAASSDDEPHAFARFSPRAKRNASAPPPDSESPSDSDAAAPPGDYAATAPQSRGVAGGVVTKSGRVSKPTQIASPNLTPSRPARAAQQHELTREERLRRRSMRLSEGADLGDGDLPTRTRRGTPRPRRLIQYGDNADEEDDDDEEDEDDEQEPAGAEDSGDAHHVDKEEDIVEEEEKLDGGNAMTKDDSQVLPAPIENGSTRTRSHIVKQSEIEARNGAIRRSSRRNKPAPENEFDDSEPAGAYSRQLRSRTGNGTRLTRRNSRRRVVPKGTDGEGDDGDDDYHTPVSDDVSDEPEEPAFDEHDEDSDAAFVNPPSRSRRPRRSRARKTQPHRTVAGRPARKKRRVDPEQSTIARTTRQSYRPRSESLRPSDFYPEVESSDSFSSLGVRPAPSRSRPARAAASRAGDAIATELAPADYLKNPMATLPGKPVRGRRTDRYSKRRSQMRPSHHDPFGTDDDAPGLNPVGIEPIQVDLSLSWDDVGGLDHHVRSLKEMVALPLMYPEVFEKFNMEAPKGVLFYGPPGTGKTLCARALAASCGGELESPASNSVPKSDAVNVESTGVERKVADSSALLKNSESAPFGDGSVRKSTEDVLMADVADGVLQETQPDRPTTAGKGPPGRVRAIPLCLKIKAEIQRPEQQTETVGDSTELANTASVIAPEKEEASTAPPTAAMGAVEGVATTPATIPTVGILPTLQTLGKLPSPAILSSTGKLQATAPTKPAVKRKPRVSFFMRNGADCLSKWVGEAERQLRMTFEAAKKHQPSIIFFDEIDGLAPVRSSRQDQIHSSIVSTLLGLMDGLDARGKIVVIGATNRVDAIDPALRRPGRFDRELIFTLPNIRARRKILGIHTAKWKPPPRDDVLDAVAKLTVGYCGADLKSLCTEAAIRALRRRYPQIYESQDKLLINIDEVRVATRDFLAAMKEIVPASHRSARTHARPVPDRLNAILSVPLRSCLEVLRRIFAPGFSTEALSEMSRTVGGVEPSPEKEQDNDVGSVSELVCSSDEDDIDMDIDAMQMKISNAGKMRSIFGGSSGGAHHTLRPRLLICGVQGLGQAQLGPALLHFFEGCPVHAIDYPSLHADAGARSAEEALVSAFREAARSVPSILYLPHLQLWWESATESLRTTLIIALKDLPEDLPLLVLATAEEALNALPTNVTELFGELHELSAPSEEQREEMFAPLIEAARTRPKLSHAAAKRRHRKRKTEVLPKAPPPPPKPPTVEENTRKAQTQDRFIRILRMEMREFTEKLLRDRRYKAFWNAVDPTSAPDYYDIIKIPMDISKIASQIDMGRYPTVLAMVNDFDIMVRNAIQYNPPNTETGAAILRRAHGLIDIVHAWVDNLSPTLIETCNKIIADRLARAKEAVTDRQVAEPTVANGPAKPETKDVIMAAKPNDVQGAEKSSASGDDDDDDDVPLHTIARSGQCKEVTGLEQQSRDELGNGSNVGAEKSVIFGSSDRHDEEEALIPASHNQLDELRKLFLDVSSGVTVDGLEALYMRCAAELHRQRRSMDRASVVGALMEVITLAREDPAVVGKLVE